MTLGIRNDDLIQGEETCFRMKAPSFRMMASGNWGSRKDTDLGVRKSGFRSAFATS